MNPDHVDLSPDEVKGVEAQWYALIAIRSSVSVKNLNARNNLKTKDDNSAIYHPINVGA